MQVKVCPKCGAESKPTSASCANCYASLDGISVTEGRKQEPVVVRPRASAASGPARAQTPPANYGPPPGSPPPPAAYAPPYRENAQVSPRKSSAGTVALVVAVLAAVVFAGWWFFPRTSGPERVVRQFVSAASAGDAEGIKACLSKDTLRQMARSPFVERFVTESLKSDVESSYGSIAGCSYEGDRAVVTVGTNGKTRLFPSTDCIEFVLLDEDAAWKIDFNQTGQRMVQKLIKSGKLRSGG